MIYTYYIRIIIVIVFGRKASLDAANAKAARERLRIIYRQNLKELGAYLSPREARYAQALRYALQKLSFNLTLRNQTIRRWWRLSTSATVTS